MDGINRVMARIDTLRSQLGIPVDNGSFKAALDTQMSSIDVTAAAHVPSGTRGAWPVAATGVPAPIPTTTYVSSGSGVVTAAELDDYVRNHRLEERNGRLDRSELQTISGGWDGRDFALIAPAADSFEQMRAAAAADGVDLRVIDAYRSWEAQAAAYEDYLAGRKKANVLPPGTSEHGQGMAVDFTNGAVLDSGDPEWTWLQANGRSFGWYPISNEAWHWEFRGLGA